jgi:hypothetical protein
MKVFKWARKGLMNMVVGKRRSVATTLMLAVAVPVVTTLLEEFLRRRYGTGGKSKKASFDERQAYEDKLIALTRSIADPDVTQEMSATHLHSLREMIGSYDQAETVVFGDVSEQWGQATQRAASDLLARISEVEAIPVGDKTRAAAVEELRKSLSTYLMNERALYSHLGRSLPAKAAAKKQTELRREQAELASRQETMAAGG